MTGPVFVTFRPAAVAVHRRLPEGSPRNVWAGRVVAMEHYAETVRVRVEASPTVLADVTIAAVGELRLAAGDPVWVAVKATEVRVYPS
jgi:molybdate transport system ATP-binding protein